MCVCVCGALSVSARQKGLLFMLVVLGGGGEVKGIIIWKKQILKCCFKNTLKRDYRNVSFLSEPWTMHDRVCCLDQSPMFGLLPLPGPVSSLFAPRARRLRLHIGTSNFQVRLDRPTFKLLCLVQRTRPATLHACCPRRPAPVNTVTAAVADR